MKLKRNFFFENNCRKIFNEKIRNEVVKKFGVYFWVDSATNEIMYIGMAGKIKSDGTLGNHSVQNRLLASRGKDKNRKKDIQTNDFVLESMNEHSIKTLKFYIMYTKTGEPPAYIEALLLYKYYKKNSRLPKLNKSF